MGKMAFSLAIRPTTAYHGLRGDRDPEFYIAPQHFYLHPEDKLMVGSFAFRHRLPRVRAV